MTQPYDTINIKQTNYELNPYLLMTQPYDTINIKLINTYHFIHVVGSWNNLEALTKSKRKYVPFHLKINTGLNRFGLHPSESSKVLKYMQQHPSLPI